MNTLKSLPIVLLILVLTGCGKQQHLPVCQLRVAPLEGTLHTHFLFSVVDCSDAGNPVYAIKFRWDMESDGIWDTEFSYDREIGWVFTSPGAYTVRMQAIDPSGQSVTLNCKIRVEERNEVPMPWLKFSMYKTSVATEVVLDGSETWDEEDPVENMLFRWDLESDGVWDTGYRNSPVLLHRFAISGNYTVTMQVMDTDSATGIINRDITVINSTNIYDHLFDSRNSRDFATVKIGDRWWMAENLDYGEPVTLDASPGNNEVTEMFVYRNFPDNRTRYGGLYLWGEAMNYDYREQSPGVCPAGWHIPDDSEWKELERSLGILPEVLDDVSPNRGDPAGTMLKIDGSSGFEAGLFGFIPIVRDFAGFGVNAGFWSSSGDSTGVLVRTIKINSGGIQRSRQPNNFAFAVRCVK